MKAIPLRAPKPFASFSPAEWLAYVRSLYQTVNETDVASVPGVSITWGKRVIIKISRDAKSLTRDEIALVAAEKAIPEGDLLAALFKRKIEVKYESSDPRLLSDDSFRPKRKAKTNAGAPRASRRKNASEHQLLEPGHHTDVPTQSTVCPADEPSEQQ